MRYLADQFHPDLLQNTGLLIFALPFLHSLAPALFNNWNFSFALFIDEWAHIFDAQHFTDEYNAIAYCFDLAFSVVRNVYIKCFFKIRNQIHLVQFIST